jgi:hypothetical protein
MPTTSSAPYSGPISVSSNETINAIAVLIGFTNSPVTSTAFVVKLQLPAEAESAVRNDTNSTLIISDAAEGATIYYTTNGDQPTTRSAVYSVPIALNHTGTLTVHAMAAAAGHLNSEVATALYTVHPYLARPTFSPPAAFGTTPKQSPSATSRSRRSPTRPTELCLPPRRRLTRGRSRCLPMKRSTRLLF